jgi:hypothetical protein
MIGDNHKDTALLVGGTRDGERAPHKNRPFILMSKILSPKEAVDKISREGQLSVETEKYVRWNPFFVDKDENKHQYLVYRHEDITEAQAFRMIIENYSSD